MCSKKLQVGRFGRQSIHLGGATAPPLSQCSYVPATVYKKQELLSGVFTVDRFEPISVLLRTERHVEQLHSSIEQAVNHLEAGGRVAVDGAQAAFVPRADVTRRVLEHHIRDLEKTDRNWHALVRRQRLEDSRQECCACNLSHIVRLAG